MGEGGALVINNPVYNDKAEIMREKGTNRSQFFRGQVAKYNWVDYGSSYLPSELNAAYLWAQLENADEINNNRLSTWKKYHAHLKNISDIELPFIPDECVHNAHMFYIKCKDLEIRSEFIKHMKANEITCSFHYVPLHSAPAGLKFGRFHGEDIYTTKESDRLVRLPMYYKLDDSDFERVVSAIKKFFRV